jgi:hypothetical protein
MDPTCFVDPHSFSKKLNQARLAEKLTVKQLAELVGEAPEVIEKFEAASRGSMGKNTKKPSDALIDRLNDVFPTAEFAYAPKKKKRGRNAKDRLNPTAIAAAVHACCLVFDQQGDIIDAVKFRKQVEHECSLNENELRAYQPVIQQLRTQQNDKLEKGKNVSELIYTYGKASEPQPKPMETPGSIKHKSRKFKMLRRPADEKHQDFFRHGAISPVRRASSPVKKSNKFAGDTGRHRYNSEPLMQLSPNSASTGKSNRFGSKQEPCSEFPVIVKRSSAAPTTWAGISLPSFVTKHRTRKACARSKRERRSEGERRAHKRGTSEEEQRAKQAVCASASCTADLLYKPYLKLRKDCTMNPDSSIREKMVRDGLADEGIDRFFEALNLEERARPVLRSIRDYANVPPAEW